MISITLAGYLLIDIKFDDFLYIVRNVPVWSLLVALGLFITQNVCRTLRFHILLGRVHIPFKMLFSITLYHHFLTRTLPFMMGEVSFVGLVHRYLKHPISEGISSLLSARLFEAILVFAGSTLALLITKEQLTEPFFVIKMVVVSSLAASGIIVYYAGSFFRLGIRSLELSSSLLLKKKGVFKKIKSPVMAIAVQLDRVRQPRIFGSVFLLSILVYGLGVSFYLLLLNVAGAETHIGPLLVTVNIVILVLWIPFSISGFGIVEGGWVFGLMVFAGFEFSKAASLGLFLHSCQVIVTSFSGLISFLFLRVSSK